eukprot:CAMPEP_0171991654 /NCGR_PEP_ID=MMETSP0993-20121228/277540_1 /TAXON_ID=483369 /ORGANISM="non described non described, Strain CCMP2098" /LENGTH=91 /DNA_ID=CAMNT_0012644685 /DNA_START=573 /DNA_END=848 /DNA_ORIENTATION=+
MVGNKDHAGRAGIAIPIYYADTCKLLYKTVMWGVRCMPGQSCSNSHSQWASQNYKYGTVNQQEDQFEMMEQPSGGAFVDNNEFDDFDQQDI